MVALAGVITATAVSAWHIAGGSDVAANRMVFSAVVGAYLAVAVLIAERHPGNRIAPVIFLMGGIIGVYLVLDAIVSSPPDPEASESPPGW